MPHRFVSTQTNADRITVTVHSVAVVEEVHGGAANAGNASAGYLTSHGQIARFNGVKSVPLFDAKNRFSELCETVARSGEPCLITRRGKPLVQVISVAAGPDHPHASVWDTWAEGKARHGPLEEEIELPERVAGNNRPSPLGRRRGNRSSQ